MPKARIRGEPKWKDPNVCEPCRSSKRKCEKKVNGKCERCRKRDIDCIYPEDVTPQTEPQAMLVKRKQGPSQRNKLLNDASTPQLGNEAVYLEPYIAWPVYDLGICGETEDDAVYSLRYDLSKGRPDSTTTFNFYRTPHLSPDHRMEWKQVELLVNIATYVPDDGVVYDLDDNERRKLRQLMLEIRALQRRRVEEEILIEGLQRLAIRLLKFHDNHAPFCKELLERRNSDLY